MNAMNQAAYTDRARYLTLDQGFNVGRAPVPAHIFLSERDEALANDATSKQILCDQSAVIGGSAPATVPLLLASYIRLAPGQPLELSSGATAEIYCVIQGSGVTRWGTEEIHWQAGDVMLFPGGLAETHSADAGQNAVLWRCTNEPQLAWENALPPPVDKAVVQPTHYPKAAMMEALTAAKKLTMQNGMKSMAIMFGTEASRNGTITPSLTLALNSIPPNDSQVPHRHNSAAITLVLQGEQCFSTVDGAKVEWSQFATFVTPGGASHAHHNHANGDALLLIVQDGGLYYHCRTMGFAITDA